MPKSIIILVTISFISSCRSNVDENEIYTHKTPLTNLIDKIKDKKEFYVGDTSLAFSFICKGNIELREFDKIKIKNGEKITTEISGDTILINLYKDIGAVDYKCSCSFNKDTLILNYWATSINECTVATFYKFTYKIKKIDFKHIISRCHQNIELYQTIEDLGN